MSDTAYTGVSLPDFDEPWQWRKARLDALQALEKRYQNHVHYLVCYSSVSAADLSAELCKVNRQTWDCAREIMRPQWFPSRPGRRMPTGGKTNSLSDSTG